MLVTTGASGHVGGLLAAELAAAGHEQRLLTRDPARVPALPGAEVVTGSYDDAESLARLLQPGDRAFMVSVHAGPERRVPLHRAFIEAAAAQDVAQIVYLSFVNAGPGATFLHARSHGETERLLAESGIPYVAVRNSMYADDIPGWFDAEGVNRTDGGDARMSFSARDELAAAIAAILTQPVGASGAVTITTPDSVTMPELTEIAVRATGRDLTYRPEPPEWWDHRWRAAGKQEWEIEAGLSSAAAQRAGELDVVSDDFRRLTGREPRTIEQIVRREMA